MVDQSKALRPGTPELETKRSQGYRFIEKDPIMDKVRAILQDSKRPVRWVAFHSGVAESTIRNWDVGKTKRPQHYTLTKVLKTLGYEWQLVRVPDDSVAGVPL